MKKYEQYYDEAQRILETMPMLPAKSEQVDFIGSPEKTQVPQGRLMQEL